jgi:hypothetical protein
MFIITSDGGGGHIATAKALAGNWESLGNDYQSSTINIMKDVFDMTIPFSSTTVGNYMTSTWDRTQMNGTVKELTNLASKQPLANWAGYSKALEKFKKELMDLKWEPEKVISTQPLCIDALAKAISIVNKEKGWRMQLEIYMTDLPTEKSTHFFSSLKILGQDPNLAQIVTVYSPCKPIGQENDIESFWRQHIGNIKVVYVDRLPIRKEFFENHCTIGEAVHIPLKLSSEEEKKTLPVEAPDKILVSKDNKTATICIEGADQVGVIMLGSNPPKGSLLKYIESFVNDWQPHTEDDVKHYLFVYCGAPHTEEKENQLLLQIYSLINEIKLNDFKDKFENLHIIPFTYQDADVLAKLFHRSNISLTKSGGSTCFELMHIENAEKKKELTGQQKRQMLIHSEANSTYTDEKDLIKHGIPCWEAGNVELLKTLNRNIEVTTPYLISDNLESIKHRRRYSGEWDDKVCNHDSITGPLTEESIGSSSNKLENGAENILTSVSKEIQKAVIEIMIPTLARATMSELRNFQGSPIQKQIEEEVTPLTLMAIILSDKNSVENFKKIYQTSVFFIKLIDEIIKNSNIRRKKMGKELWEKEAEAFAKFCNVDYAIFKEKTTKEITEIIFNNCDRYHQNIQESIAERSRIIPTIIDTSRYSPDLSSLSSNSNNEGLPSRKNSIERSSQETTSWRDISDNDVCVVKILLPILAKGSLNELQSLKKINIENITVHQRWKDINPFSLLTIALSSTENINLLKKIRTRKGPVGLTIYTKEHSIINKFVKVIDENRKKIGESKWKEQIKEFADFHNVDLKMFEHAKSTNDFMNNVITNAEYIQEINFNSSGSLQQLRSTINPIRRPTPRKITQYSSSSLN